MCVTKSLLYGSNQHNTVNQLQTHTHTNPCLKVSSGFLPVSLIKEFKDAWVG